MLNSAQLKKIREEARPYIRRQMEDAKVIASFREVVAAGGGDWSALKAVIKAEIQDEDDDAGDGKKIGKIIGKAEWTRIYADMLGLGSSNMNEKNSFADGDSDPAFDRWLEEVADRVDPLLLMQIIEGSKSAAGRAIIMAAIKVVQEDRAVETVPPHDAETGELIEQQAAMSAQTGAVEALVAQTAAPIPQALAGAADTASGDSVDPSAVPAAPASNVTPIHRFNPATHFANSKGLPRLHGCTRPEACGGSHRALCFICSTQHDGPAYQDGAA